MSPLRPPAVEAAVADGGGGAAPQTSLAEFQSGTMPSGQSLAPITWPYTGIIPS
jgi:hypothetical protein